MLVRRLRNLSSLVLVALFVGVAWYVHVRVLERTLDMTSAEDIADIGQVLSYTILDKYTDLLRTVPAHVSTDPYHVNLMIKLRAEFVQALQGLKGVTAVLYGSSGSVIFTVGEDVVADSIGRESLSGAQLATLTSGGVLRGAVADGRVSAIFPVVSQDGGPTVFLQVVKDCKKLARALSRAHGMFVIPIGATMISCVCLVVLFYRKSAKLLSSQYDANLELQEQKETAERESVSKSQFLANVSHELRTPLNSIIGFSEIIQSESLGPIGSEEYKEYISDIHQSGVHLLSLINDILDFSKAEANKLTVEFVKFDLSKIVDSSFTMVLPRAKDAKVELKKEMPEEPVVMLADPKRMKQVIINILSNSVKFTPEGGLVKLCTEIRGEQLVVEISDTGIGIAQQDLYKVMSVFGQADSKHSRKYEGTGLGLPLSKKLVELMHGTFSIKSEPNLGTIVTLTFPHKQEGKEGGASF
ncbi:sensor histidine kinase [Anaplasma centrale str. Israel]|uniref:histidine kinase n=1 Tax=Anaplasma centrale (strain Israel) TaxID=574556 RepID=D1ASL4_ANACI|nr:HAMP domain-containing sensor histidine kinase [Anaplasma centrale]ACZ49467.1 sensor histidine kinase [Anaplasma centrale str. Israel]